MKFVDLWIGILSFVWISTWFAAIWIEEYRIKLSFTGLFALILAMMSVHESDDKNKDRHPHHDRYDE